MLCHYPRAQVECMWVTQVYVVATWLPLLIRGRILEPLAELLAITVPLYVGARQCLERKEHRCTIQMQQNYVVTTDQIRGGGIGGLSRNRYRRWRRSGTFLHAPAAMATRHLSPLKPSSFSETLAGLRGLGAMGRRLRRWVVGKGLIESFVGGGMVGKSATV